MLTVNDFQRYVEGRWTAAITLPRIESGKLITLVAPNRSGKTAFCKFVAGVADPSSTRGELAGPATGSTLSVAYVPSNPSLLFSGITTTLLDEIRLVGPSPKTLAQSGPEHARTDLHQLVTALDLRDLLERDPLTLSGGEAARAAIGVAIVHRPDLVIIDQAYESLYPGTADKVWAGINSYLPADSTVIEAYSRKPGWLAPQNCQELHSGWSWSAEQRSCHVRTSHLSSPPRPATNMHHKFLPTHAANNLSVSKLTFSYGAGKFALPWISMHIGDGARIALVGPNGSGKTTLLKSLALVLSPRYEHLRVFRSDGVQVDAPPSPISHTWARYVRYSFQNPDDQIFRSTVIDELTPPGSPDRERTLKIAETLGLSDYLQKTPFDLTLSERRLLTIGEAINSNPRILLLDEPSVHLDQRQLGALKDALAIFLSYDSSIVAISHDDHFIESLAMTSLDISEIQRQR